MTALSWGGVDDDWKAFYTQAVREAAAKDYTKAELTYAKALGKALIFGQEDPRVGSTLQGLATLLRLEKKLTEAEDTARHAVSVYGANPGVESIEYADAQFLLAGVLMDEGKY